MDQDLRHPPGWRSGSRNICRLHGRKCLLKTLLPSRQAYPFVQAGIPLAYIFAETSEERDQLAAELKPVAEKHKGAVSFATIDAKSFGAHAGNLNLEVDKWPAFAIQETVKNQKYPFDQSKKLTEKDIGAFVQDFVDGKIEPSIKSEPVPEKQEGPVQVVVAHNYKDIVMDTDKDVLLEFYAPWCGHCKAYYCPQSYFVGVPC